MDTGHINLILDTLLATKMFAFLLTWIPMDTSTQ